MKYPLHSAHSAKVALGGHESEVEKSTELNLASLGAKWHTREWKTSTPRVLFPWEKKLLTLPGLPGTVFATDIQIMMLNLVISRDVSGQNSPRIGDLV